MKMHQEEFEIDAGLVAQLVDEQFPAFRELPIQAVQSTGTVNAIYRLGDELYARLPRMERWAQSLQRECHWLPKLAQHLTIEVPEAIATGEPADNYPFRWAIYRWITGQPYSDELIANEEQAANILAQFVLELRRIDPVEAPRAGRRPLRDLDRYTRAAIEAARGVIDSDAATIVWERALKGPEWVGTPVWIHTDLLRPNVLVERGVIRAIIDFGGVGVGDPAADVIAAWSVFRPNGRRTYLRCLDVDEATWNRARGFALHQAAMIIPYYAETNPEFVTLAKRTIHELIADM
jgi:aminoglycoside phosphotransferase (APT) family kinase protein